MNTEDIELSSTICIWDISTLHDMAFDDDTDDGIVGWHCCMGTSAKCQLSTTGLPSIY